LLLLLALGVTKKEKIMNTPLQKFKILKGKDLIVFLINRFDFTNNEAIRMEMRMPGGMKVQVI
jgi:hypothetical protein